MLAAVVLIETFVFTTTGFAQGQQVPQWIGGTGNWHNADNWLNGIPTSASTTVLIDNDAAVNSVVYTEGQNISIQNLVIDSGDTLMVDRGFGSTGQFGGNLFLDTSSETSTITNNGLIQVGPGDLISGGATTMSLAGRGVLELDSATIDNSAAFFGAERLVNGIDHTIRVRQTSNIAALILENRGLITADSVGSEARIKGRSGTTSTLQNDGIVRAANGGDVRISTQISHGGVFEANGNGSEVFFDGIATTVRDATFRTSNGGIIRHSSPSPLSVENLANEGFFSVQHIQLVDSLHNVGTIQAINSFNNNFSLGSDVVVGGDGTLDFRSGGKNVIGDFAFENQGNRMIGKGTFAANSIIMGDDAILDPNNLETGGLDDIGVFEFRAPTLFDGAALEFDLLGDRVEIEGSLSDPNINQVNAFVDTFIPENGLDQVNIEYDQLNIFDTLTIDGLVELDISLVDGFLPTEDDFFDILTADELVLNGSLDFDLPVINGLTFDHQILNLFDPTTNSNRDVLRITFGANAVPEPSSGIIMLCLTALIACRRVRHGSPGELRRREAK